MVSDMETQSLDRYRSDPIVSMGNNSDGFANINSLDESVSRKELDRCSMAVRKRCIDYHGKEWSVLDSLEMLFSQHRDHRDKQRSSRRGMSGNSQPD